jgi:hypothetical protein
VVENGKGLPSGNVIALARFPLRKGRRLLLAAEDLAQTVAAEVDVPDAEGADELL